MTTHPRAKLGLAGRRELVRAIESGESQRAAAARFGVSPATANKWWRRWQEADEPERASLACLRDRSSRRRRSPNELAAAEQDRICEVRRRTGWGPRLIASESATRTRPSTARFSVAAAHAGRARPREAVVRYEWPCPGNLLHMDTKRCERFTEPGHAATGGRRQRNRGARHEYVHSLVDDCSRLAYSEVLDDERAATVTAFTRRALDWFLEHGIVAERILTDNAWTYTTRTAA